jgi:hypothetical protein
MLTLSDPGSMGRQRRTHGAQVYCTSSPGDRQHLEAPTSAAPHGIDFRVALNGYDKLQQWVFDDYEVRDFHRDEKRPDSFAAPKVSGRGARSRGAQTGACRAEGVSPAGDRAPR